MPKQTTIKRPTDGAQWTVSTIDLGHMFESIAFEEGGQERQLYLPDRHDQAVRAMRALLDSGADVGLPTLRSVNEDGIPFTWDGGDPYDDD